MQRIKTIPAMAAMLLATVALTACDSGNNAMAPAENAQPRMGSDDAVGGDYGTPAEKAARKAAEKEKTANERLAEDRAQVAIAVLHPTKGNDVSGTVKFTQSDLGVQVVAEVKGLTEGVHAMHVHIYGDCTAADASSAGTHFNFQGSSLNPPPDISRITGNLGELKADAQVDDQGSATLREIFQEVRITGPKSIIGRAVIVHEKGNDMSQPPMGATGARLACGVIGIANPGDGMGGMNMDMQEPMDTADMPGEKAEDMDDTTDAGSEEAADNNQPTQ